MRDPGAIEAARALLRARDFVRARARLRPVPPADLAAAWKGLTPDERAAIVRLSLRSKAARLFEELPPEAQAELACGIQRRLARDLLGYLDPSQAARLLRRCPAPAARGLLGLLPERERSEIERALAAPEGSVAALMRARWLAVGEDETAERALAAVRASRRRHAAETRLDAVLVLDERGAPRGVAGLEALEAARPHAPVSGLMDPPGRVLRLDARPSELERAFVREGLRLAPVVDASGRVAGVLAERDVLPALRARRGARARRRLGLAAAAAAAAGALLALAR